MSPHQALIVLLLITMNSFGQKKKLDPSALVPTNGIVYSTAEPAIPASWQQWVDKDGVYHSEFVDPANKWRCRITSLTPDDASATIVCSKDTEPEKRK